MKTSFKESLFLYPDPITDSLMITGASFLYFDVPLIFTLPPQVITPKSFELLKNIEKQKPEWGKTILQWLSSWEYQRKGFNDVMNLLVPLKDRHFKAVWVVYSANDAALSASQEYLESAGYDLETAHRMINPLNAAGEAIRHIFLEKFLELGEDTGRLYDYCGSLFRETSPDNFLTKSYFLRLPMMKAVGQSTQSLMLTNPSLLELLDSMPIEPPDVSASNERFDDVISWELFRRILSPRLDPLSETNVELINNLVKNRKDEITRLKQRCLRIASEIKEPGDRKDTESEIERILRFEINNEISDVLELDRQATQSFITELFCDEKTWLAFAALVAGLASGGIPLTSGADNSCFF